MKICFPSIDERIIGWPVETTTTNRKDLDVVPYLFVCRLHSDVANRLESGVCRVPFQLPDFAAAAGDDTTAPRTNFFVFSSDLLLGRASQHCYVSDYGGGGKQAKSFW